MAIINKEKIARINHLAKKAKSGELTADEIKEREILRREYIDAVKNNARKHLDKVRFVEDMSPEELAEAVEKQKKKQSKSMDK